MGLSDPKIKKLLKFIQKKLFLYFREHKFLKKLLLFEEGTFRNPL